MTKEAFLAFCGAELGTEPDYPFDEDFKTAVLRHKGSRKWFAVVMRVSRRKFGLDSDEAVDIVNGYFLSGRYPGGHCVAEKPRLSKKPRFACRNCLHITLLITF